MNQGIKNEYDIVEVLDHKQFKDIPPHFKVGIRCMYRFVRNYNVIWAQKVPNFLGCKTDIQICLFGEKRNISIKTGHMPSLHKEIFESFMDFLWSLGISQKTLLTVRLYHFADGTLDGSGSKKDKLRFDLFREKYKKEIEEASEELSQEHIVRAIVQRAIIQGRYDRREEIHFFYYGTKDDGKFFSKEDLLEFAPRTGKRKYTSLHFGPFVYVAKIAYSKSEPGKIIQYSQIIWPEIKEDLDIIYDLVQARNEEIYYYTPR